MFLDANIELFGILIGIIAALAVIGLIIFKLRSNDVFPFKKMKKKKDFDNCYDLKNRSYYYGNTNKKKK